MFKSSLTGGMIEAAYMTGILPIKKYGTQSAMTDFREYTMAAPKRLAKYTGFTESIYNPNAIVQAMQSSEFGTYWTETETYESLKIYIDMDLALDGLKQAIVAMLGGERCEIDIRTFQNDMQSIHSKDDLMTLLVHLGYLASDADSKSVYIPNEEVRQEFIRAMKHGKHKEIAELIAASDQLLRDTVCLSQLH